MADIGKISSAGIVLAIFMFLIGFVSGSIMNSTGAKPTNAIGAKAQPIDDAQNRRLAVLERQTQSLNELVKAVGDVARGVTEINTRLDRIEERLDKRW